MRNAKPTVIPPSLTGLDLLVTAVVLLDRQRCIVFANTAALQSTGLGLPGLIGQPFAQLFVDPAPIDRLIGDVLDDPYTERRHELRLDRADAILFDAKVIGIDAGPAKLLIELSPIEQRYRIEREERMLDAASSARELVRNLAHEIKNPLGGIRGAAQLLSSELPSVALREYTQVIIKEADRLQTLVDRLLAPHRHARHISDVNIHEVCERVRSVILAEYGRRLRIERDYDASLPEFRGDKEQLIQVVLNLVRNAAQAISDGAGDAPGRVALRTRIARQATIGRQRYRLALDLHVVDDGPGIAEALKDRIFMPLVSGREGGSGLGLTLAQTFVAQHGGTIECNSRPGRTEFIVRIPLP